jgi:hypothetical protein
VYHVTIDRCPYSNGTCSNCIKARHVACQAVNVVLLPETKGQGVYDSFNRTGEHSPLPITNTSSEEYNSNYFAERSALADEFAIFNRHYYEGSARINAYTLSGESYLL